MAAGGPGAVTTTSSNWFDPKHVKECVEKSIKLLGEDVTAINVWATKNPQSERNSIFNRENAWITIGDENLKLSFEDRKCLGFETFQIFGKAETKSEQYRFNPWAIQKAEEYAHMLLQHKRCWGNRKIGTSKSNPITQFTRIRTQCSASYSGSSAIRLFQLRHPMANVCAGGYHSTCGRQPKTPAPPKPYSVWATFTRVNLVEFKLMITKYRDHPEHIPPGKVTEAQWQAEFASFASSASSSASAQASSSSASTSAHDQDASCSASSSDSSSASSCDNSASSSASSSASAFSEADSSSPCACLSSACSSASSQSSCSSVCTDPANSCAAESSSVEEEEIYSESDSGSFSNIYLDDFFFLLLLLLLMLLLLLLVLRIPLLILWRTW